MKKCNIENCRGCDYEEKSHTSKFDVFMYIFIIIWVAVIVAWLATGHQIIG